MTETSVFKEKRKLQTHLKDYNKIQMLEKMQRKLNYLLHKMFFLKIICTYSAKLNFQFLM